MGNNLILKIFIIINKNIAILLTRKNINSIIRLVL